MNTVIFKESIGKHVLRIAVITIYITIFSSILIAWQSEQLLNAFLITIMALLLLLAYNALLSIMLILSRDRIICSPEGIHFRRGYIARVTSTEYGFRGKITIVWSLFNGGVKDLIIPKEHIASLSVQEQTAFRARDRHVLTVKLKDDENFLQISNFKNASKLSVGSASHKGQLSIFTSLNYTVGNHKHWQSLVEEAKKLYL